MCLHDSIDQGSLCPLPGCRVPGWTTQYDNEFNAWLESKGVKIELAKAIWNAAWKHGYNCGSEEEIQTVRSAEEAWERDVRGQENEFPNPDFWENIE